MLSFPGWLNDWLTKLCSELNIAIAIKMHSIAKSFVWVTKLKALRCTTFQCLSLSLSASSVQLKECQLVEWDYTYLCCTLLHWGDVKNKDLYQSEKQEDLNQRISGGEEESILRVCQVFATAAVSSQDVPLKHWPIGVCSPMSHRADHWPSLAYQFPRTNVPARWEMSMLFGSACSERRVSLKRWTTPGQVYESLSQTKFLSRLFKPSTSVSRALWLGHSWFWCERRKEM